MGSFGTKLYDSDTACDVREDYIDKLKQGINNEEATNQLIEEYKVQFSCREEAALFWFALADAQWDYGRLLPLVKEKALAFIPESMQDPRWKEAGEKKLIQWQNTLNKLKDKLDSPQPAEKKIAKHRLYRCEWSLGDVFVYQFFSPYSLSKGFFGKYIAFRKVSEDTWWPGHIVPLVQVYNWIGDEIPTLSAFEKMPILGKQDKITEPQNVTDYVIKLLSTSKRIIPKDHLTYLGNIPTDDSIPVAGKEGWIGYTDVGWDGSKWNNQFEPYILDWYLSWNSQRETNE